MEWKEIFENTFPINSEVVIEDNEGYFLWGKITIINDF